MAESKKKPESLVIKCDCSIEGIPFAAGTVVGEQSGESIVATHKDITRGHIEARLASGVVVSESEFRRRTPAPAPGSTGNPATGSPLTAKG